MDRVRKRKNWTLEEEAEQSARNLHALLGELERKSEVKDKKHQENKEISRQNSINLYYFNCK